MSDERDPDRTDGRHPDEPQDAGHEDAAEAPHEAEAPSPYGPADPGASADPDRAPAADEDGGDAPAADTYGVDDDADRSEGAPVVTPDAEPLADAAPDADAAALADAPIPARAAGEVLPPADHSAAGGYAPPAADAGSAAYAPPVGHGAPAAHGAPTDSAAPAGYAPPAGAPPYVGGPPARPRGGKGLAIAALVVGIAAVVAALIPFLNYVSFVPAFAAIILGIISLARRMDGKPLAVTGLILGIVGFVLGVILAIVYTFAFVDAVSDAVESSGTGGVASPGPTYGDGDGDGTDPDAGGDAAGAPGTSPEDPLPIGTTVTGEGVDGPEWSVTLGQPILDATAAVLAADPANPEPAEGMQYAVVPVTVTYLGQDQGDPLSELVLGYLAPDGSPYSAADAFALAPAPAFADGAGLLEPQGTASGNVVVEIPIDGAGEGLWATVPGLAADAYYFRAG
ncbi:hypothetical protein BFL36_10915 [Clavibacter michiganensis]|uniref:DUF4190 domain-containing protein n=1 Tax=Clavibacter michiganensis TaxID=28447 RepID=A0A251YCE9_9MICO|nr:DUF4190 domain-containing protein [Clavibacter michiganensis]OUE21793.1 hypothetical protein BFL36_10915 [Clavibacter michiganensis]